MTVDDGDDRSIAQHAVATSRLLLQQKYAAVSSSGLLFRQYSDFLRYRGLETPPIEIDRLRHWVLEIPPRSISGLECCGEKQCQRSANLRGLFASSEMEVSFGGKELRASPCQQNANG